MNNRKNCCFGKSAKMSKQNITTQNVGSGIHDQSMGGGLGNQSCEQSGQVQSKQ